MNKIKIDEEKRVKKIGFTKVGEHQEGFFAENYLEQYPTIKEEGNEFYSLCPRDQIWIKIEDDDIKRIAYQMFPKKGKYIWRKKYENNYFQAIKMLTNKVDTVNPYPHRINFQDSVYDFKKFKHEIRSVTDYFTYEMGYSVLKVNQDTPTFDKFIDDITLNRQSLKDYLLTLLAYLVSGHKMLQKFFILKGDGANGKSTLINLLIKLIDEQFVTSISLGRINDRFTLSKVLGKKLMVASENESVKGVQTETIKKLTGDDLVEIEKKYQNGFSKKITIETVFALNNTISFSENSYGLKRRLEVIPFDFRVKQDKIDKNLDDKLEKEIPSIMAKLIGIHKKFAENGYKLPSCEEVEKAKEMFLSEGIKNSLGNGIFDFLEENIIIDATERVSKNDVYRAYSKENIGNVTPTKFWMDFNIWQKYKEYKIKEINSNGRHKIGMKLKRKGKEEIEGILG